MILASESCSKRRRRGNGQDFDCVTVVQLGAGSIPVGPHRRCRNAGLGPEILAAEHGLDIGRGEPGLPEGLGQARRGVRERFVNDRAELADRQGCCDRAFAAGLDSSKFPVGVERVSRFMAVFCQGKRHRLGSSTSQQQGIALEASGARNCGCERIPGCVRCPSGEGVGPQVLTERAESHQKIYQVANSPSPRYHTISSIEFCPIPYQTAHVPARARAGCQSRGVFGRPELWTIRAIPFT